MSEFSNTRTKVVQVQIPPGQEEGSLIHVESDGKLFSITVPAGVKSGDTIAVEIQEDVEENTTPLMVEQEAEPWVREAERIGEGGEVTQGQPVEPAKKPMSRTKAGLGAAALGAVVGTLLIGPITGVVVAGVALYATTRNDRVGAAAIRVGGAAASGYDSTKAAAEKHDVYNRMKSAGAATAKRAGEIDQQYKISENVTKATKATASEAIRINNKYDITGQAARGIMSAGSAIGRLVAPKPKSDAGSSVPMVQATATSTKVTL